MSGAANTPERVTRALRELYGSYGFLASRQVLTFHDTDGRLLALKPDVTLSIVKSAANGGGLRKVFYHENVYREPRPGEGFHEIPQTGLECIGALDGYAVGEVVMLAARSLQIIGGRCVLDVSHIGLVSGVLDAAGVDESGRSALFRAVGAKNLPGVRQLCRELGMAAEHAAMLERLVALYGPLDETLPAASALPLPARSRAAVRELESLAAQLALYGLDFVNLDFSVVNDVDYYDDIVFRGFVEGAAAGVLSGGRYDRLMARMGKPGGAIGFAVYLDRLERVRETPADYDADVLVLYSAPEDVPRAVETAEALVRSGETVRVERAAPEGLRFRRTVRAENGEVREC